MKKLPVGVNNFEKMIGERYYFVDKTMLIKDVVDLQNTLTNT